MAEKAKRKLVVIEEGLLAGMAAGATFVKEFPFLRALASQRAAPSSCRPCSARSKARLAAYGAAKKAIAAMDAAKKRRLKELLNAQQVRVTYLASNGRAVQVTF